MALRKIHRDGEPVLRKKAKTVTKFDGRLALLLDDMKETLTDANGVGLAAPQVGVLKRVIMIDAGAETGVIELVNPVITKRTGVQEYYEGCLSYPGYYGNVGRPESVTVRATDRGGGAVAYAATGLYAVACCHEADHLEGEMFMQKVRGPLYTLDEVKAMRDKNRRAAGEQNQTAGSGSAGSGNAGPAGDARNGAENTEGEEDARPQGSITRIDP